MFQFYLANDSKLKSAKKILSLTDILLFVTDAKYFFRIVDGDELISKDDNVFVEVEIQTVNFDGS